MKNTVPVVATMCALLAVMHCAVAQAQSIAPSAVNEKAPVLQPLAGTLFFSQQERAKMDRVRKTGVRSTDDSIAPPSTSTLNGFVKRSDGQSTIWVDGAPRFNVRSDNIARLQPMDVGGSTDTVRVRSSSIAVHSSVALPVESRKHSSPRPVKKHQTRRPAPKK